MSDSNLRKNCNDLVEKIVKEYDLIKTKVNSLDSKEVAKKPSIYEKIKPIVDNFQDDLVDVTSKIYDIINDLNTTLSNFFDSVEKDLELLDESELDNEEYDTETDDMDTDEANTEADDTSEDLENLDGPNVTIDIE